MEIGGELKNDVVKKLYAFCAYRERCASEVIKKLDKLDIPKKHHNEYLRLLQTEQFLNEARYAEAFARGKFLHNKWGKRKIVYALKQKQVPDHLINEAVEHISYREYYQCAEQLAAQKLNRLREKDSWKATQKIYNFLAQKGYEQEVIRHVIEQLSL